MLILERKEECCGCTACVNICPVDCIAMQADEEGFLYPHIEKDKCIECNQCAVVCPINNNPKSSAKVDAVCARAKDLNIVRESTSGGFFTPIAQYVLDNDGIVVGAICNKNNTIEHIIVNHSNKEELEKYRGSKYVQSELGNMFSTVKSELEKGTKVCFSGTPCQISGLFNYLKKDYENLITIDMICKGVPSPKLWKKYVDFKEKKYNSKIKQVSFRKKTYGYHSGTMELLFENGKKYCGSGRVDYYLKSFYKDICSRPSCYECSFKSDKHPSDYTIFESWHASTVVPGLKDDNLGYTSVLINSDKGRTLFSQIKDKYEWYPIDKEQAIELDGIMVRNNSKPHPKRYEYYKDLDNESLDKHIEKFIPISKKDYLIEKSKAILFKTKILYLLKRIKRKVKRR